MTITPSQTTAESANEIPQHRRQPVHAMSNSSLEALFMLQLRADKLPEPVREHKFHERRKWRFDFCWPDKMLAVEVEGGIWTGGRHTRGDGYEKDAEKYNAATEMGWRILRFTPKYLRSGEALEQVKRILAA